MVSKNPKEKNRVRTASLDIVGDGDADTVRQEEKNCRQISNVLISYFKGSR